MVAASAIPRHPPEIAPRASDQARIYALQSSFSRVPGSSLTRIAPSMNVLSRDKQVEVIAALCEGVGVRTASRLTRVNRGTVANLALRVGMGCMELHDRIMVALNLTNCGASSVRSKRTSSVTRSTKGRSARFHRYGRDAEGNL